MDACQTLNVETAAALRSRITEIVRTCTETAFHNVAGLPITNPNRVVAVESWIPTAAAVAHQPQVATATIPVAAQPWAPQVSRNPLHEATLSTNPFRPENGVHRKAETSMWHSYPLFTSTDNDWFLPAIAGTVTNPFASSASPASVRTTGHQHQAVSPGVGDRERVGHVDVTSQHGLDTSAALQEAQSPVASP